jgi:hypothetical protein
MLAAGSGRRPRIRRDGGRGSRQLLALALAMALLGIAPAASQASATGFQAWGAGTFEGHPYAKGVLEHQIQGHGLHVDYDQAAFTAVGTLCDTSMKFTYAYGKFEYTGSPAHSNVHWGCSKVGNWKYSWNRDLPRGKACAELWAENWRHFITKQCHFIY